MKKVLVIGSKGFIGSHCVRYFEKNYDVWRSDIVVDYVQKNYVLLNPVNDSFEELFKSQQFDLCINCSGAASVQDSNKNPQRDFELNTHNVFRQLDAIRKHNPDCKYINLSSAAVYGNPEALPVKENQTILPISPYGLHKKMAEEICKEFSSIFGLKTCSLRIFSAYGPGLKKQLFWDLNEKAKKSHKVELFGTGNESRDFIYITDLVSAIELVAIHADFKGEAINCANGKETSIADAVRIFYDCFGGNVQYSFSGQFRAGDPINWFADISKLIDFRYQPKISLEEGLQHYLEWLKG